MDGEACNVSFNSLASTFDAITMRTSRSQSWINGFQIIVVELGPRFQLEFFWIFDFCIKRPLKRLRTIIKPMPITPNFVKRYVSLTTCFVIA
jgi:hypothetical protein